ncbi:hypothetical protein CHARACLAT_022882 [Characodon lateralis]|uniref:Uncharacterized protein n=1 Tax=Characodon lateralis TaxID=208331 RepID=A0ABU7DC07_9TELE|nr:hypothetical protein [Characodon lateralis]
MNMVFIISSRYLSTSRTSPGSFPPNEVTFHIPRTSPSNRRSGAEVSTYVRCPILFVPFPHSSPCRWWSHWGMVSRLSFQLGLAESREEQPGQQALSPDPRLGSRVEPRTTSCASIVWTS